MDWLAIFLRVVLGTGGVALLAASLPFAVASLEAEKADSVVFALRAQRRVDLPAVRQALDRLEAALRWDPAGDRRLALSELQEAAYVEFNWAAPDSEREQWLRAAEANLVAGLAARPAHGIAWLRLASVRQTLHGAGQSVVVPLLMSIETVPVIPRLWPLRHALILRNYHLLPEARRAEIDAYVVMTWRHGGVDRRWFVRAFRSPLDELVLRAILADEPGALDELTRLMGLPR